MRTLFALAVIAEVVLGLGGVLYAGLTGNAVALPGGIVRLAAMAFFGFRAARRHSRWALWAFVTLEYLTAFTALALGLVGARGIEFISSQWPSGCFWSSFRSEPQPWWEVAN